MGEKSFKLEIVTPQKVVFNGEVDSFSAPGVMGNFQVLYNHAPLLAAIDVGEAKLRDTTGANIKFATSGGFVEVKNNHVVMLAETAERADEIDLTRAEKAKQRAKERLENKPPEVDFDRARVALFKAINRIKVAQK